METAPGSTATSPRTEILQAVADTAERVLLAGDWQTVVDEVLEGLGRAAGASRGYIIRNRVDASGSTGGTLEFEWCADGIGSLRGDPFLARGEGFPRWAELHRRGEPVIGTVATFPELERTELERIGIVSIVELPIVVDGRWWGALGLDDERVERRWDDGEVEGLRAVASVIAAAIRRQRSYEELSDSRERYRQLVERIPGVTYTDVVQPDGSVRMGFLSPQMETLLGYPSHVFLDDPERWFEIMHPDDLARLKAIGAFATSDTSDFDQEYRMISADGDEVWVHDTSIAVYREDGSVDHFLGFLVDISERVKAERRLRGAEEHYRALVERIPGIVYTASPDTDPERFYISPQVATILGYEPEEWRWTPGFWSDRIHPDDLASVHEANSRSNELRVPLEYRFRHAQGHWVWLRDEARFVAEPEGDGFWQGVLFDVSERKEAEAQLARALETEREAAGRLRTLDEMKNTFLQAVSHDLRTPLAAILGLAITLGREDVVLSPADARDLATRIADNARRLDRLVTNLLDLDRLSRGIVSPQLQPTDVGELARRVVRESGLIADERLTLSLGPAVAAVDAAKVERIIENLVANAARHTPADSQVWVRVWTQDDGVALAVEDDGEGVDADIAELVFEPFQQGPGAPRHAPGVGVGLALVQRFAELHGGRAWVEDRDGGGASFRVWLPREARGEASTD